MCVFCVFLFNIMLLFLIVRSFFLASFKCVTFKTCSQVFFSSLENCFYFCFCLMLEYRRKPSLSHQSVLRLFFPLLFNRFVDLFVYAKCDDDVRGFLLVQNLSTLSVFLLLSLAINFCKFSLLKLNKIFIKFSCVCLSSLMRERMCEQFVNETIYLWRSI